MSSYRLVDFVEDPRQSEDSRETFRQYAHLYYNNEVDFNLLLIVYYNNDVDLNLLLCITTMRLIFLPTLTKQSANKKSAVCETR